MVSKVGGWDLRGIDDILFSNTWLFDKSDIFDAHTEVDS
jgi:hypothetical protein